MTLAALASLALLQLLIAMSPGPATVLTIRTAAAQGIGAGIALAVGLALAILVWAAAALTGLSVLFEVAPWLQAGLRIIGGLFLIWIGIGLWRGARAPLPDAGTAAPYHRGGLVRTGLLTNLANPKALAYFAAVFTGILPADTSWTDAALILITVFIVECAWYGAVAALFSRAAPRAVYARIKGVFERSFGGLLSLFGIKIALG